MKYKKISDSVKVGKIGQVKSAKKWAKKLNISKTVFEFYAIQNGFLKIENV